MVTTTPVAKMVVMAQDLEITAVMVVLEVEVILEAVAALEVVVALEVVAVLEAVNKITPLDTTSIATKIPRNFAGNFCSFKF